MSTKLNRDLKRKNRLFFDLSDEELELFNKRFGKVNTKNRSEFIRQSVLKDYIIVNDDKNLRDLVYEINRIGNNINQLTKLSNENNQIYKEVINEVQSKINNVNKICFETLINHNKVR